MLKKYYLSPYIVTGWFCGIMFLLLFSIKEYEQTLRHGLCLSDSGMPFVHFLTIGIPLLDRCSLLWEQICCYQFNCIVTDFIHSFIVVFLGHF